VGPTPADAVTDRETVAATNRDRLTVVEVADGDSHRQWSRSRSPEPSQYGRFCCGSAPAVERWLCPTFEPSSAISSWHERRTGRRKDLADHLRDRERRVVVEEGADDLHSNGEASGCDTDRNDGGRQ